MNKFTRSQMGKIMAYALSAAMAVTVVPTYMMKPLVAEAAVVETAEVSNGKYLTVKDVSNTKPTRVALFTKKADNTGDKAVYVFDEIRSSGASTADVELAIPYDVPAGTYYIGIKESDDASSISDEVAKSAATTYTIGDELVKINEASPATAIAASVKEGKTVYLEAKDDADEVKTAKDLNLTTTVTSPSSTATYLDVKYERCDKNGKVLTAEQLANEKVTVDTDDSSKIKIAAGAPFGTYYFKATATVANKNSETGTKEITAIAQLDIAAVTNASSSKSTTTIDRTNMLLEDGNDAATVTANILSAEGKANVTESINWTVEGKKLDSSSTPMTLTKTSKDGIDTYSEGSTVYATYEPSTGKFVPKQEGAYTITWEGTNKHEGSSGAETAATGKAELNVYSAKFADKSTSAKVGASTGTTVTLTSSLPSGATYEYSVEDPEIASVNQISGIDTTPTVKALKAGATKLVATIRYYDGGMPVTATRETTIVSTVDAEDLDLASIDNPEDYVNAIVENADNDVKDVIIEAIIDGTIDATQLTPAAIAALDAEVNATYGRYFTESVDNTANTAVTANGLVLSAVYDGILDEDTPKNPVEVKVTVSKVRASDKANCVEDSVADFVAEYTIDGKASQPNTPIALTYTATKANTFNTNKKYDVYEDGVKIATVKPTSDTVIAFNTSGFSVFSIVEADTTSDDDNDNINIGSFLFSAHVQRRLGEAGKDDKADMPASYDEELGLFTLGTHGASRRVEAITLTLPEGVSKEDIVMNAHVQRRLGEIGKDDKAEISSTDFDTDDNTVFVGTKGESRRLEAFSIELKGDLAEQYDVYYRVHAQNVGWLGWASNGDLAGTAHKSLRLEAVEIVFVEKGTEFDASQYIEGHEDGDRGYLNSTIAFIDGSVK